MAVFRSGSKITFHAGFGQIDILTAQNCSIALINQHQAATAAVHNSRLFQGRKHIRGFFQDRFPAFQNYIEKLVIVIRILGCLLYGVFRHNTRDCQNCAFLGLHHSLVCHFRSFCKGLSKLNRRDFFNTVKRFGESAQQLACNDAGIAACAFQRAFGQCIGCFVSPEEFFAVDLTGGTLHRKGHICSCIAVRNREYIQRVDSFPVFLKKRRTGHNHVPQQKTVNCFELYQRNYPPSFIYSA